MVSANWKRFKLKAGRISIVERIYILNAVGDLAREKYDEFVVTNRSNYDLQKLRGFLKFELDPIASEIYFYLQGPDQHWTDIANYFEYGTGLYNQKRAGKYRAGYIRAKNPTGYMKFKSKKTGAWVTVKQIKGVKPIFAMTNAVAYIKDTFAMNANNPLYRKIRWRYQNE